MTDRRLRRADTEAASGTTFGAVVASWLAKKGRDWCALHYARASRAFERDVLPRLGPLPVSEVTPAMVAPVIEAIAARGARETAAKHFKGEQGVVLAEVDPEKLPLSLKWEPAPSRGGPGPRVWRCRRSARRHRPRSDRIGETRRDRGLGTFNWNQNFRAVPRRGQHTDICLVPDALPVSAFRCLLQQTENSGCGSGAPSTPNR